MAEMREEMTYVLRLSEIERDYLNDLLSVFSTGSKGETKEVDELRTAVNSTLHERSGKDLDWNVITEIYSVI